MRLQVDAMLRTAALVGAITLLTACSGGDIVVKTDLDESYVVKESAVTEIEPPIESAIKNHEKDIKSRQNYIQRMSSESKKCARETILSQADCDHIYLVGPAYREKIKTSEEYIKVLKEAAAAEKPWFLQIKYRPIFIDLNGQKKAMGYVTLTCFNPNVENMEKAKLAAALGETFEDVDLSKAYYSAGLKVCQKYAYKDGDVFAYREAKKSDESKESD
ncbi:putative lipoprotein [Synechococcus sp. RS9907]|nr:putative lipoprotein [Synechococcus sp. RS9907]